MITRSLVLLLALAACGTKKPAADKVTSFERGGFRFTVPQGWTADLRLSDVVTLAPENPAIDGPNIVVAGMAPGASEQLAAATPESCGRGFRSADAVKPPGQVYRSGKLVGCVSDYTQGGLRQKRWEVSDGKSAFSVACNRIPGDEETTKVCEALVVTASR